MGELTESVRLKIESARETGAVELDLSNPWNSPSEANLREFPEAILELGNLEVLKLEHHLISEIPEGIARLQRLRSLFLSCNRLTRLPDSIGTLVNLERLYLGHNRIDSLPGSIENLTQIHRLHLANNRIEAVFPWLPAMRGMTKLNLSRNRIADLNGALDGMSAMELLEIGHNPLRELPPLANFRKLTYLDLSNLNLAALPESIGTLTHLVELRIGENRISVLPRRLAKLKRLKTISVEGNPLDTRHPCGALSYARRWISNGLQHFGITRPSRAMLFGSFQKAIAQNQTTQQSAIPSESSTAEDFSFTKHVRCHFNKSRISLESLVSPMVKQGFSALIASPTHVRFKADDSQSEIRESPDHCFEIRADGINAKKALDTALRALTSLHVAFLPTKWRCLIPCICSDCKTSSDPHFFDLDELRIAHQNNGAITCPRSTVILDALEIVDFTLHRLQFYEPEKCLTFPSIPFACG